MGLPGMQLVFHGGKCCGIKTIYGFESGSGGPDSIQPALEKIPRDDADACGHSVASDKRFFHDDAPVETAVERLDRYIAYMKRRRPGNLLEVVLAHRQGKNYEFMSQKPWVPILLDRGFKEAASQINSNSGNICTVYYLNIDEEWPGKASYSSVDDDEDCDDGDYYEDEDSEGTICSCGCGMIL